MWFDFTELICSPWVCSAGGFCSLQDSMQMSKIYKNTFKAGQQILETRKFPKFKTIYDRLESALQEKQFKVIMSIATLKENSLWKPENKYENIII